MLVFECFIIIILVMMNLPCIDLLLFFVYCYSLGVKDYLLTTPPKLPLEIILCAQSSAALINELFGSQTRMDLLNPSYFVLQMILLVNSSPTPGWK